MEVVLGVLIGIAGLLGITYSRIVTTFFHELGHAIPALLFTEDPVTMYVGSYGETKKSLKMKLGRLTIYLSFVIWDLEIGLCTHRSSANVAKQLAIILGGPLLSLILGGTLLYLILAGQFSEGIIFILAVFMISCIWDFFVNMVPRREGTAIEGGEIVYNDGRQFLDLIRVGKLPLDYFAIREYMSNGEVEAAATLAQEKIKSNPELPYYHQALLDIIHPTENPHEYIAAFQHYIEQHDPSLSEVARWAEAKIQVHEYDEVIQKLTKIIFNGKGNYDLHFLRGKALTELGEYHDAMRDFHALTLGKVEDPRALANRAYCQLRLGYEGEAREDVREAVENGRTHMGEIYYLAGVIMEDEDELLALDYYKKAEALKYDHHALPFNISRIEKFK